MKRIKVEFDYDTDPDFSWLEQDHYNPNHPSYAPVYATREDMEAKRDPIDGEWYRDPANHVALAMLVYEMDDEDEDWEIIDSLGGIDFLVGDEYVTGTYYRLSEIPAGYQRELAEEAGLPI